MNTKTTRLPVDLIDAAEDHAKTEHRSTAKQLEHWARLGMFFDGQNTTAHQRIRDAIAGELPLAELTNEEQAVANASISATISTTANNMSFAERLAEQGVTTIVVNDDGDVIKQHPDGTTTTL